MPFLRNSDQVSKGVSPNEFIAKGIDREERSRRSSAMRQYPELALFGDFLHASQKPLNPEVLKTMSSNANVHGEYNLSIHESLSKGQDFNEWEEMSKHEIDSMKQLLADNNMFRWILKGFYLYCKEKNVPLPHQLDIFKPGVNVHLQDIAEFIELLY